MLKSVVLKEAESKLSSDGNGSVSGSVDKKGPSGGRGLAGLLLMKKRVSNWKLSRLNKWGNTSGRPTQDSKPKIALENTYQLQPREKGKFCPREVQEVMDTVLAKTLSIQTRYDAKKCPILSRLLTEEIKTKVKALGYTRYKIVVHLVLGQDLGQGTEVASRSVWDPQSDSAATTVYRVADLFAVASVFGTYFE